MSAVPSGQVCWKETEFSAELVPTASLAGGPLFPLTHSSKRGVWTFPETFLVS